jgi:hypothetical protein
MEIEQESKIVVLFISCSIGIVSMLSLIFYIAITMKGWEMKKVVLYIANNLYVVVLLYVTSITVSGYLFSTYEDKPFLDGVWWY